MCSLEAANSSQLDLVLLKLLAHKVIVFGDRCGLRLFSSTKTRPTIDNAHHIYHHPLRTRAVESLIPPGFRYGLPANTPSRRKKSMKKMLLVLCVVMMGSLFASATHYTITLTNFCDTWRLNVHHDNTPAGLLAPKKVVCGV